MSANSGHVTMLHNHIGNNTTDEIPSWKSEITFKIYSER